MWAFGVPAAAALVAIACSGDGPTGPGSDQQAPIVTVTTPSTGALVESDRVDLVVGLTDDKGLRHVGYLLNGTSGDSASVQGTTASHTFHVQGLAEGENVIAVVARDLAGNVSEPRSIVVTRRTPDEIAPVVVITAPAAGAALRDDSLTITGRASDAVGVRVIRWQLNGGAHDSLAVSDTGAAFSVTVGGFIGGVNTVRVEAADAAGNAGDAEVAVTHDRVAPDLVVDAPADSTIVLRDSLVVSGTVADTGTSVASVTVQLDTAAAVTATVDSIGGFTAVLRDLREGSFTVTVRATDVAGNVAVQVLNLSYRIPVASCAAPTGFTKAWVGATSDWGLAENWSPAGVPTASDDVFVCAAAEVDPVMQSYVEGAIRSLRIEAGASLALEGNTLAVLGNLEADGAITGGYVDMQGSGVTLRGTVPALLIDGSVTALDSVIVTGDLSAGSTVDPLPVFTVGAAHVRVAGGVFHRFGLVMRDSTGVLDARGGFYTEGGGWYLDSPTMAYRDSITAGTVRIGGTFRYDPRSVYTPAGTHVTVFDDTLPQNVSVSNLDQGTPFNHVEIRNAAGVTFGSDVRVRGRLAMVGNGMLVQDTAWSTVFDSRLPLTSTGYRVMRTMVGPDARLDSDLTLQLPPAGRLEVGCGWCESNSRLDVGPHRLTIKGDLYSSTGYVVMADPAGYIDVQGDVTYTGAYSSDSLLTGTMRVTGDLTAEYGVWGQYVYRPRPAHTLVLDGAATQHVGFAMPYPGHQHLPTVEIRNAVGVQLDTSTYVTGQLRMIGDGRIFPKNAADTIRYFAFGQEWNTLQPSEAGTPFPITSAGYEIANNAFAGHWVVDTDRTVHLPAGGQLQIGVPYFAGGDLRVADGRALLVQGGLSAVNGNIYLHADDAVLNVRGDVVIGNAFGADSMTAGALHVGGNFTQLGPDLNWGFQPGGTHTTVFDGAGTQLVEINGSTSMLTRRFQNLSIAVGADVRFTTDARVAGSTDIFGTLRVSSGTTLGTEHAIYLRSGGTIDNAGGMFCNHTYTRGETETLTGTAPTCNQAKGTLRVRLAWADSTINLDGHLAGPAVDGSTATFLVNPSQPTYSWNGAEYTSISDVFSNLAIGPEIIESYTTAGRYRYEVKLAPGSAGSLAASGATVIVESFQDLGDRIEVTSLGQFTLPVGFSGDTWSVFELENRTVLPTQ